MSFGIASNFQPWRETEKALLLLLFIFILHSIMKIHLTCYRPTLLFIMISDNNNPEFVGLTCVDPSLHRNVPLMMSQGALKAHSTGPALFRCMIKIPTMVMLTDKSPFKAFWYVFIIISFDFICL